MNLPFDSKPSHSRLLLQELPDNSVDLNLFRWLVDQFFRLVLIADIVTNTDEFATIVRASKKYDGNAQNLRARELGEIGGLGFEDKLVDAYRNGANEE